MFPLRETRQCSCTEHRGDEDWHTKTSGYYRHGCRCAVCMEFMRSYAKARYHNGNAERHRETVRSLYWSNRDSRLLSNHRYRQGNRQAVAQRERKRADVLKTLPAPKNYQRWTPEEDAEVLRMDLTLVRIAAKLGRSFRSVKARRSMLRKGP